MADFDLTQTDQQVQNILNDGQSAMGAGAQTTLTTEYVMLKDTNGVYHKILKSSFTEAIRDVLAGLLVNNDKGTTISQIAAIASGDFGSVTPANLASVLGRIHQWFEKKGQPNTVVDLGTPVGAGGIMVFNPNKSSANLILAINDTGVTLLNHTWYSDALTFSVVNDNVCVSWAHTTWERIYIYRLV